MPKPKHEQWDFRGNEIIADEFTGTLNGTVAGALTGVTVLTNSTGATANNTVENVPLAVAAATGADTATLPTLVSVNASITAIENDLSDLAAKINEIINALN